MEMNSQLKTKDSTMPSETFVNEGIVWTVQNTFKVECIPYGALQRRTVVDNSG